MTQYAFLYYGEPQFDSPEADSLEAAAAMAKASPCVEVGGAVHVAEVFPM